MVDDTKAAHPEQIESRDTTLTVQEVADFLRQLIANKPCSECGNTEFSVQAVNPEPTAHYEPYNISTRIRFSGPVWHLHVAPVVCTNCAHTRLFSLKTIERNIRKNV
jgi:predicted nucleic-acid-binding Zn-ribbon protein